MLYEATEICEGAALSVLSFNVLLPHAWWVPKYYDPNQPDSIWQWEHRRKLLQQQLCSAPFDVLALQEINPQSFEADFSYLWSDYEGFHHRRSRISSALCWRRERFRCLEKHHLDRCVVALLEDNNGIKWAIASAHLSAGAQPRRRLQQVAGVLKRFARIVQEHSISGLVIAGDMNSSCNQTAVNKLLREGCVTPAYREPEFPAQELSSKARCHDFLPFVDAYELHPTPTMWVRDLLPVMLTNTGQLSKPLTQNLQQLFEHYADKGWMNALQQRQWITQINGAVCGVEAELAEEISGPLGLSFEQFLQLHQRIIGLGQHWSVDHSLRCHGLELSLPVAPKTYCLDRIWISSTNYVSDRCLRPLSEDKLRLLKRGETLPNAWHPSDHLPLGARIVASG